MHANLIAGDWVEAACVSRIEPLRPLRRRRGVRVADETQVDDAIVAAVAAAPAWAAATPQERARCSRPSASSSPRRAEELGDLLAREEGKTLPEAVGEVLRASPDPPVLRGRGGAVRASTSAASAPASTSTSPREPVGVVGIITPWNFPIAIPAWKIAPALAYGNTVVFKPADSFPASAWALVEVLARAGVPDGRAQPRDRAGQRGRRRARHRSARARRLVHRLPGRRRRRRHRRWPRRFGGSSSRWAARTRWSIPDDADLDLAVDCALQGASSPTGQRCTASSRLIATAVSTTLRRGARERMRDAQVGHALADGIADWARWSRPSSSPRTEDYLALGRRGRRRARFGGRRLERDTDGYYLEPALLVGTPQRHAHQPRGDLRAGRRRDPGDDPDEALAVANDTEFGLSAGIVTTSLGHAAHFRDAAGRHGDGQPPDGRRGLSRAVRRPKGSSNGPREQGRYAASSSPGQDRLREALIASPTS